MFDVGFSEILVIGVVALIVLGPERLPKVARTLGALLGRVNRYAAQVKQDIDRELRLEELRKVQKDMQESAQRYEIMAGERVHEVEASIHEGIGQVAPSLDETHAGEADPGKQQAEQQVDTAAPFTVSGAPEVNLPPPLQAPSAQPVKTPDTAPSAHAEHHPGPVA